MTQLGHTDGATRVNHRGEPGQARQIFIVAVGDASRPRHPSGIVDKAVLDDDHGHAPFGQRLIETKR